MKKLIVLLSLSFLFACGYSQAIKSGGATASGNYVLQLNDTVTADSSQVAVVHVATKTATEINQAVVLTKVSGYVKVNAIRAYSFDGSIYTNLDTATYAGTVSGVAKFNLIDNDYLWYKITVDGVDSTQVDYPVKLYTIIRDK